MAYLNCEYCSDPEVSLKSAIRLPQVQLDFPLIADDACAVLVEDGPNVLGWEVVRRVAGDHGSLANSAIPHQPDVDEHLILVLARTQLVQGQDRKLPRFDLTLLVCFASAFLSEHWLGVVPPGVHPLLLEVVLHKPDFASVLLEVGVEDLLVLLETPRLLLH